MGLAGLTNRARRKTPFYFTRQEGANPMKSTEMRMVLFFGWLRIYFVASRPLTLRQYRKRGEN